MARPLLDLPPAWRAPQGPVLLIEPDPRQAIGLVRALSPLARVRLASGLADGLAAAALERPELLLVSDMLPEAGLGALRRACRDEPALAQVPMMVLLSRPDERAEVAALAAGAVGCLPRHAGAALVAARMRATLQMLRSATRWRLSAQAETLSDVASRRQLDALLQREWRQAQRLQQPLALLWIEPDQFHAYNECHGSLAGGDCLGEIALHLLHTLRRPADRLGQGGGETLLVVLPHTEDRGGLVVAGLLLKAVADRAWPHGGHGAGPRLSVSIGVAAWRPGSGDPGLAALLTSAEAALCDAQLQGGDGMAWRGLADEPAPRPGAAARRPVHLAPPVALAGAEPLADTRAATGAATVPAARGGSVANLAAARRSTPLLPIFPAPAPPPPQPQPPPQAQWSH